MRTPRSWLAPAGLTLALACSDAPVTTPVTVPGISPQVTSVTTPATGPWARIVEGRTGPNSLYAIYVPREWNGDAVTYAHGFRDAAEPVSLRDQDQLYAVRDQLGTLGFAVLYSSFDDNGLAVKSGILRTHQLRGLLASELGGAPARHFLFGASLGGAVALELAEQHPSQYDGAFLLCGMVGGTLLQTQYVGHVRVLFDHYFPGAMPGSVAGVPPGQVPTTAQVQGVVLGALPSNPLALFAIASTLQTPLPYVPMGDPLSTASPAFQSLVYSLAYAVAWHARGINDVLQRTHGHPAFGNIGTQYQVGTHVLPAPYRPTIAAMIASANANAGRFAMSNAARNFLEHYTSPTGDLRIPVLTLHNAGDPGVPAFHEGALLQRVQAAGREAMLLQRLWPNDFGHCVVPPAVSVQGFLDLVQWVTTGVKPAS